MTSYLFIEQLFKNVLAKSIVMQGRLRLCPGYGNDMNRVDQVIEDLVKVEPSYQWPAVLMMPPQSEISLVNSTDWERYLIELYFLTTSFASGNNQIKSLNKNTQTSGHSIPMDWHDMKRCAIDFIKTVSLLSEGKTLNDFPVRLVGEKKYFSPMSFQGNNRLAGVRLSFKIDLFPGCEIEDYADGSVETIVIPELNTHPTHYH